MSATATIAQAWNRFWFAPVAADAVGLMRASLGLLLVVGHVYQFVNFDVIFGADGPVPAWVAARSLPAPTWSWYALFDDRQALLAVHLAGLIPHVLLMLGFKSRTMAFLSLLVQAATYHRNPYFQHGGDRVMRLATLSMIVVPCGAALSVDAWLGARKGLAAITTVPATMHRLVQIQWVVIYAHSGWVKSAGRTWENGEAIYYAMSAGQYQRFPAVLEPLLQSGFVQDLMWLATYITVVWEAGFGLLVLWKPTRYLAVIVGVLVHGGIALSLMVGAFSVIMIWGYLAFLPPDALAKLVARLRVSQSR